MTLHLFWVMDHYENLVKRLSSEKNAHMHTHLHTQICILMREIQRLLEPSLALLYPKIEAVLDFCQVNSFQLSCLGVRNDSVLTALLFWHSKFKSLVMFKYGVFNFLMAPWIFLLTSFSIVCYHPYCKDTCQNSGK